MLMSKLTWLWRKSWILMRFTPVFLQPLVPSFDERAEHSPKLARAIKAWKCVIDSERAGEMTPEEVADWKASFGAK